ncbi:uncharacterized protein JN550_009431 [Neoarthrinium moseri]|uniref:uncharacterized protein n=1 Tax=Neoarthrinium moseri TaxID=1658444 RepID=UPI001FDC3DD3|nr:uncharacterized protein JN550_009431 [Neoarthrinium moseri]KAI1863731.1 hypothetical protein JN550_009431 [Neoarthrinium moseri]
MATRTDLNARPRARVKTTYGKTSRSRPSFTRAASQPVTATDNPRPSAVRAATTRQQQPTTTSSTPLDNASPEPLSVDGPADVNLPAHSAGKETGTDKKRKIAQIYSAHEEGQDPLSEDSSPSAPRPRQRSRVSSPTENVAAKGKTYGAARRMRSTSADMMDVEATDGILSSPPPTPVAPKERRAGGKQVREKALPFSPNTWQSFDNLQVGDSKRPRQHQIPIHLASERLPKTKSTSGAPSSSQAVPRAPRAPATSILEPTPAKKPRKKLIDALMEQMEESDGTAEDRPDNQISWADPVVSSSQTSQDTTQSSTPTQTPNSRRTYGNASVRTIARSGSSLKYTYGQSRVTMLEEDNLLESLALPEDTGFASLKGRRLELGGPKKPVKSSMDFEDDDALGASPKGKIRDIHELKQAGENSRVADEMFDLSSQIGQPTPKPSSSRRTALLQVAEKVQQKDYRQRLRNHGIDATVLKGIGSETDVISGYLVSTILLHFLATSSAPHIIQLLRTEDAGYLFGRLLDSDDDIKRTARDRKTNLSKRNQTALIGLQASLLQLPIWELGKPESLSPRTVALKGLELITSQDVVLASDPALFPDNVTHGLFGVLPMAKDAEFWDEPTAPGTFDLRCSLSILEYHAVKAMESQDHGEQLAARYLPILAEVFASALQNSAARDSELESLLLKLVLNMTNASSTSAGPFLDKGILPALASSICTSFTQSAAAVAGDGWSEGVLNNLVLRIGILVNFAEQSTPVRKAVHECSGDDGSSPMKELIRIFLDNHRNTAEADSEAKSQLNVAFGYLSVLLGHLCLYQPIRRAFKASHSAKSLGPLLDSIQEFISHHRAMEASLLEASPEDPRTSGGYTDRLQELVDQLQIDAVYD